MICYNAIAQSVVQSVPLGILMIVMIAMFFFIVNPIYTGQERNMTA